MNFFSDLLTANQFTGYEHSRITDLLAVLALTSILMWIIVYATMLVRLGAILVFRLADWKRKFHTSTTTTIGKHNES